MRETGSDVASDLLAELLLLQKACVRKSRTEIQQIALRCEQMATCLKATTHDRATLDRLQCTASATAAFLRHTIRDRGMRLTIHKFTQAERDESTSGVSA